MNIRIPAIALAATLILSSVQSTNASDLDFALATLKSANTSYSHIPAQRRQKQQVALMNNETPAQPAPQLLLGAYLEDTDCKVRVVRTLPGSPASQVLKSGDVIRRISVLGQPSMAVNTKVQFDHAKRQIGPNRQAALEIDRPSHGIEYVWVTFETAGQLASFTSNAQADPRSMFNN